MRLGGPILSQFTDPEGWVRALADLGYRAAFTPIFSGADADLVHAYAKAAQEADIVIAEVPAWSNPISRDPEERQKALDLCKERLALADAIGARCAVNIAGSPGRNWVGPNPEDLTDETFDLIVESVREIIDAVRPIRSYYTLETSPWMYPDSIESYERLIEAVGRERFGVHFDPVNLICSPQRYFQNGRMIKDFVDRLGPHIRSCHAKDITMAEKFMVHLDETPPGKGHLEYGVFLKAVHDLDPDLPIMMEHMKSAEEYQEAAAYIRRRAREVGLDV